MTTGCRKWYEVSEDFFNILFQHDNDYLVYMQILFSSGCEIKLDYLIRSNNRIIVDVDNYGDNEPYLLEACFLNVYEKSEKYVSLNAMLEGHHHDDEVEEIFLFFNEDKRSVKYLFDGNTWNVSENKFAIDIYGPNNDLKRCSTELSNSKNLRFLGHLNNQSPNKNNKTLTKTPTKHPQNPTTQIKTPEPSNKSSGESITEGHNTPTKSNTAGGA